MIELLVVITIIGVLAGISIFALQGARESARDAKRKGDLESIRSALEIYKADCNQYPANLPAPGNSLTASCPTSNTYMEEVPGDPVTGAAYRYCSSGSPPLSYDIYSHLEDTSVSSISPSCGGGCNPSPCRYEASNP